MEPRKRLISIAILGAGLNMGLAMASPAARADEFAVPLPRGVRAVWDLERAARDSTPHRERVCINGLWRWQPAGPEAERPPAGRWGYFKVPGAWPGGVDDMLRDSQTLHAHPDWKGVRPADVASAWYEREIAVPASWAGRRVALRLDYLNSYAAVFLDGEKAGEVRFPAQYGLRQVFPRVADHPIFAGLAAEHLADWRGESTILPPRLDYERRPRYGPTVLWAGLRVPRVWRCGNRGNVASVLIEKPPRGDFLPVLDGGFSLQYSPLLEYREGRGMVLFCQLDVTGRTGPDPAADALVRNLFRYATSWKPSPRRDVVYAGDAEGLAHLRAAGISARPFQGETLTPDRVLAVGPGGRRAVANRAQEVADWVKAGGRLLAIGLDEEDASALLPDRVRMRNAEHIAVFFEPFGVGSPFAGVGPADVHNRDPRTLPLVAGDAGVVGDGVLAHARSGRVVFCQLVPWQFDYGQKLNVKRTYRRAAFLVSRLLANMGARAETPLLARFGEPANDPAASRWLDGLYLDRPEEGDDPYRFFRW